MATILVNGCFDILHAGHVRFLLYARYLGVNPFQEFTKGVERNRLVVAVNSDESGRRLKSAKWGEKYPIDNLATRMANLMPYADEVWAFDTEEQLEAMIIDMEPCVICKGPDYAGKRVTGDEVMPVIILDTPEPESVKQMKISRYKC